MSFKSEVIKATLPIIIGMFSQVTMNFVDALMVGCLNVSSLAALGIGSSLYFIAVALFIGFGNGVQILTSKYIAMKGCTHVNRPFQVASILSVVFGLPISLLFLFNVKSILLFFHLTALVEHEAGLYLSMVLLSIPAVGIQYAFRGYFSAIGKGFCFLRGVILTNVINALLGYVLIFGQFHLPCLGVEGAGLATTLSLYIGLIYFYFLSKKHRGQYASEIELTNFFYFKELIILALPNSLEQCFFGVGFFLIFWIVSRLGMAELAATHIIVTIDLLFIMPSIAFGLTSASNISHALASKLSIDVYDIPMKISKIAITCMIGFLFCLIIFPADVLEVFTSNRNVIDTGIRPLQFTTVGLLADMLGMVYMYSIQGLGRTVISMSVSLGMQWLFFLPLAYFFVRYLSVSLAILWLFFSIYRALQSCIFMYCWRKCINLKSDFNSYSLPIRESAYE